MTDDVATALGVYKIIYAEDVAEAVAEAAAAEDVRVAVAMMPAAQPAARSPHPQHPPVAEEEEKEEAFKTYSFLRT